MNAAVYLRARTAGSDGQKSQIVSTRTPNGYNSESIVHIYRYEFIEIVTGRLYNIPILFCRTSSTYGMLDFMFRTSIKQQIESP